MNLYWVSAIIFNEGDSKPWLCAISSGAISFSNALIEIQHLKENHNVLSAWIDTYDENDNKETVFHECYM